MTVLGQNGVTAADASAGPMLGGPLKMRATKRGPDAGGAREGTPEFFFTDPDAILVQLQHPSYVGGAGPLGSVATATPSPRRVCWRFVAGVIAPSSVPMVHARNKFYQDVFGVRPQAYQGPGHRSWESAVWSS